MSTAAAPAGPPTGFVSYQRPSAYLDLIGPLYEAAEDPSTVRLLIDGRHTNSRGFLHAGVLSAVADTIMGHTAGRGWPPGTRGVTASMTIDFTGSAAVGDWVQGRAAVRHSGRQLSFTECEFHVGGRLILAASGIFAVRATQPAQPAQPPPSG
jgi:uncharacterized protein (TIGR00369 family)